MYNNYLRVIYNYYLHVFIQKKKKKLTAIKLGLLSVQKIKNINRVNVCCEDSVKINAYKKYNAPKLIKIIIFRVRYK